MHNSCISDGVMVEYIYTSGTAVTPQSSLAKTALPSTYSAIASSCTMSDYEDNYDLWELRERHPSKYGNNSSPRSRPASPIDDNDDTLVEASPLPSYSPSPRVIPPPLPAHLRLTNVQRLRQNLNRLLVRLNQATRDFEALIWGEPQRHPFSPSNTNFLIDFTVLVEQLQGSVRAATEDETILVLDFHVHEIDEPTRSILHREYLRPLCSLNRYWGDYFARVPKDIKRIFDHHRLAIAYHLRPPVSTYEISVNDDPARSTLTSSLRTTLPPPISPHRAHHLPTPEHPHYPALSVRTPRHPPRWKSNRVLQPRRDHQRPHLQNPPPRDSLRPLYRTPPPTQPLGQFLSFYVVPSPLRASDSPVDRRARETLRHHLASRFSDTDFDFLLSTYDTKLVPEVVSTTASEDSTTRPPVKDTSTSSSETQTDPHLTSITTRGATKSEGVDKVLVQTDTSLKKVSGTSHFASEATVDSSPCHNLSRPLRLNLQSKATLKRKNSWEDSVRSPPAPPKDRSSRGRELSSWKGWRRQWNLRWPHHIQKAQLKSPRQGIGHSRP
ncbi:hypothetical protein NUW54_g2373 [Trametes sanguinea]|uniref:Uncharacterized protein n=1 Tax=Trametes sanguinea TaxID=158606 RepID=A0ACC1Q3Z4_9APHY|nr:hypothetical protein NUW54_g2373 [Trametes sanguinea]